jgi:anti-sigma factor RsiW
MRITDHAVAAEELMALLDGELGAEEARVVAAHVEGCAECGEMVRQFRAVSESMATWTVEDAAAAIEEAVMVEVAKETGGVETGQRGRPRIWSWKQWAMGGSGAAIALLILLGVSSAFFFHEKESQRQQRTLSFINPDAAPESIDKQLAAAGNIATAMDARRAPARASGIDSGLPAMMHVPLAQPAPAPPVAARNRSDTDGKLTLHGYNGDLSAVASTPMIARTVALTIVVKDVPAARADLERVLAHYRGYAAQLTVNTPEGGARSFQASLRVPAPELATALAELRALGHVENESQAGEEVTQQHADLVARLQNSRETEQRLKDILTQRTGKIEDVLQVEEEIARVRGEIEGMEADQKTLEHRVDFASVDLQMSEVFKAQLGTPSASVGNQMRNAFVSGLRGAGASLLGVVLFVEEAGPAILVWLVILGVPGWLLWRRYRRMRAQV